MNPSKNLEILIKEMTPELDRNKYYFCTSTDKKLIQGMMNEAFALINESEGVTLIIQEQAATQIPETGEPFARIELKVYSSLEAVGSDSRSEHLP